MRFGMRMSAMRITQTQRPDRMLLLSALSIALLTLLGATGGELGLRPMDEGKHGQDPPAFAASPGLDAL